MDNQMWINPDRNNLVLQARFARQYGFRLGRLYKRTSNTFRFLQIFTGSAAFGLIIGGDQSSLIVASVGLTMAIVSAIDMVWQPSDASSQCFRAAEQWGELAAQSGDLDDDALLKRVEELQSLVLPSWKCLVNPVFNQLMSQTYLPGTMPEGTLQRESLLGKIVARLC